MNDVEEILKKNFGNTDWLITKPQYGLSKESYIAKQKNRKLFIKFDVNAPALTRLSNIQVTPPIVAQEKFHGRDYVIQEFLEGIHPDRTWFKDHIPQLVDFLRTYHSDRPLSRLLSGNSKFNFQKHTSELIKQLNRQIKEVGYTQLQSLAFRKALVKFKNQKGNLTPVTPEPIHADPNYKNFLISKDKIYLIDWDDILLSDPLRDIGLILWWYLPKNKWMEFFNLINIVADESIFNRLYWWVAARSLAISLWFLREKGDTLEASHYLEDFLAAVDKKDNPNFKYS